MATHTLALQDVPAAPPRRPLEDITYLVRLGLAPSRWSAYDRARRGLIPGVVRIGGRIRVIPDRVDQWIADGCPPVSPQE
jgi:hypothetical protein